MKRADVLTRTPGLRLVLFTVGCLFACLVQAQAAAKNDDSAGCAESIRITDAAGNDVDFSIVKLANQAGGAAKAVSAIDQRVKDKVAQLAASSPNAEEAARANRFIRSLHQIRMALTECLLLPIQQGQQLSKEQMETVFHRDLHIKMQARERLAKSCALASETLTVPDTVSAFQAGKPSWQLSSKKVTVGVSGWSGRCQNGVRDGEGVLTEFNEQSYVSADVRRTEVVSKGRFAQGAKVGPWRFDKHSVDGLVGAYVIHGWPESGFYLAGPDGSFRLAKFASGGTRPTLEADPARKPVTASQIEQALREAALR